MTKARILVVEDETIVRMDIQRRLIRLGYSVVGVAARGDEAVAKAAELDPDLVLMDVRLEGYIDGIEAARRILAQQNVPIIYITAYASSTDSPDLLRMQPCLGKPFRTLELKVAVAEALMAANKAKDSDNPRAPS